VTGSAHALLKPCADKRRLREFVALERGCDYVFTMKVTNVFKPDAGFQVLETTERSQTAVMSLEPGEESSEEPNTHPTSDQTLIVIDGEVFAEIAGGTETMRRGDSVIVPAGTPHKFTNKSENKVVTFSVYSPPAYPPGTRD
jgi:mannose-6-phosphate isomerase-like protein (cupin superfamily)